MVISFIFLPMDKDIKDTGKMIWWMVREVTFGWMEKGIKASGKTIQSMGEEKFFNQTDRDIKENLRMEWRVALEFLIG